MKYSDLQRIEKIYSTTNKLLSYIHAASISQQDVMEQEPLQWTVTTPLYNIGEHAYYLSNEFKEKYPEVPWAKISGLRHRLVHNYDDTNWSLISSILFDTLPEFQKSIHKILDKEKGSE